MNRKWWMVFIAAVLMVSMLAACSGGDSGGGGGEQQSGGTTTGGSEGGGDGGEGTAADLEPVTFTYFNAGASRQDVNTADTMIGALYAEETGVSWQIEHLVGEVQTRIGTMIAGGEYPDVVVPDSEIDTMLSNRSFIDLAPLIEEHGPNIKEVYGPYWNLMETENGEIFILPFSPLVNEFHPSPVVDQGAYWIQRRVLKEFGYPEIKTLDEYFGLIRDYIALYPDEDLIGFTALTDDWRLFAFTNQPNHLAGYPNDGEVQVDMETMEAKTYAANEDTKRWLKMLNELNAEGLFDPSSFINNYDQYLARIVSGNLLGYFDYGWQANQASQSLETGDDDLRYFPLPIVFDHDIKDQYLDPPSFVNNRGIGITVSAEDPERIVQFWNYMLEPENQVRNQWGIQGVTYEVDDNGRFYRTQEQVDALRDQEYKQEVGLTYFEYYWPMYGQDSTHDDGNAVAAGRQPEVAALSFTEGDNAILAEYGVKAFTELFAQPDERPWFPAWDVALEQGSPEDIYVQRKEDLQRELFPNIVLADPADFEAEWDRYVEQYNQLDVELYEETMTRLVREKAAAMTGE